MDSDVPHKPLDSPGRHESGSKSMKCDSTFARTCAAVTGGALIALLSATPNAFNTVSGMFQTDTGASKFYVALLLGIGVAGLQFTLPAGILLDRMGPAKTCVVGLAAVVGGYMAMSYTDNLFLLLVEYAVASLGSGTTFLCALSTAIGMGYPIGIALVSLTMSLSISFTVLVDKVYGNSFDCADDPHCWREYVRVYALLCGGVFALGVVALAVRPQRKSPQQPAAADVEDQTRRPADDSGDVQYGSTVGNETGGQAAPAPVRTRVRSTDVEMTLAQSVRIFRKPFFVAIFFANTIGLGAGILVITAALQMWEQYNNDHTKTHWNQLITVYFSVFSGGFNVISPLLSDFLHKRGYLRRSHYLVACLGIIGADFVVLGIMTIIPHHHHGACHLKMAYVFMMALVGGGFGTFLTILPTLLEDIYGMANFGRFMSYMQLGSTIFAVAVPTITSAVESAFHSYNSLYWSVGGLLLLAAVMVWVYAEKTSPTFGMSNPARLARLKRHAYGEHVDLTAETDAMLQRGEPTGVNGGASTQ